MMKKENYRVVYKVKDSRLQHDFSISSHDNEELKFESAKERIESNHPGLKYKIISVSKIDVS